MIFTAKDRRAFEKSIDALRDPASSIVARYRNAVQYSESAEKDLIFKQHLLENSIREGAGIVELLTYKGVTIHILDESSGMATGSLKSIDGCLTAAYCQMDNANRIVFESGGNSGSAFTRYGMNAGVETFFFCPMENLDLLDSRLFRESRSHLIGVTDKERLKEFTHLFARQTGLRHVPDKSWRYAAAMFRGMFILEQMLTNGKYDWISQTVSAAFGPIGIYNILLNFSDLGDLPRFLGVQQEANCPMYAAWKPEGAASIANSGGAEGLLTRVMYDNSPQTYQTYSDLQQLLIKTQGDLLTINLDEYGVYTDPGAVCGSLLDLLFSKGIDITIRAGEVVEKTGIIALAGTLKAIDAGTITEGSSVLCCLTGGVTTADGCAEPEVVIRDRQDLQGFIESVGAIK